MSSDHCSTIADTFSGGSIDGYVYYTINVEDASSRFVAFDPAAIAEPLQSRGAEIALWSIAAACGVVALVAHRPDIDDAFYLNLAAAAADAPTRALMSGDTS